MQWFPKISLHILEPQILSAGENVSRRDRRKLMGEKLYDLMTRMIFNTSNYKRTLYDSLLNASSIHGNNHKILEDSQRKVLSYKDILLKADILGQVISNSTSISQLVNYASSSCATAVLFWALQALEECPP